jgi:hypothetical protein
MVNRSNEKPLRWFYPWGDSGKSVLSARRYDRTRCMNEREVRSMVLSKVKWALIAVLILSTARLGSKAAPPAPAPAATNPGNQPNPANVLKQTINYDGTEDPRVTLGDLLEQLSKRYGLTFDINEKAFEMDQLKDVARTLVADPTPIPPMRTTFATVLRKVLRRVPAESGATFLIRRDHIEITTESAVRAELGIPEGRPLLPLVWDTFTDIPIAQVLQFLADSYDYNLVTDPQGHKQLQTKITAQLHNVPIDTAVRLLANMANLRVVKLDNVLYMTTPEKAEALREEQE